MTRFAIPLADLNAIWNTRAGAVLVESAVLEQGAEDAEIVRAGGADALVLRGPDADVAAQVAGLFRAPLPGPGGRHVRVYAETASGWRPALEPPEVPVLPDEAPVFAVAEVGA